MTHFTIREEVEYQVEAEDAETALKVFLSAEDPDEYCTGVQHREVVDENGEPTEAEQPKR